MFMLAYLAFYQCDIEFDLNPNNFFKNDIGMHYPTANVLLSFSCNKYQI